MASTSTNKQPLLVDRVFYESVRTDSLNLTSGNASPSIDLGGTNESAALVDCTQNDGAIIEDMFVISRSAAAAYKVLFYLSTANDFLRPQQAIFIGDITSASSAIGVFTNVAQMPRVLAPSPQVAFKPTDASLRAGEPLRNEALYVPRGKCLWVTLQRADSTAVDTPIVGVMGGFY